MRTAFFARLTLAGALTVATVGMIGSPAAAAPVPAPAPAASSAATLTSTVSGTFANGGTVTGTFTPSRFVVRNGKLVAVGSLRSVLTNADGSQRGTATSAVTLPVQAPAGDTVSAAIACPVLNLVLGPLDLNLLGLVVHLDRVVLDITAVAGAGNLLGNLLCAVAGLLNGGLNLPLGQLAVLLNAILALLGL